MSILTHKSDTPVFVVVMLAIVVTLGVSALAPVTLPWSLFIIAAVAVLVYWVTRWDVLIMTWGWVGSFALLDYGRATTIQVAGFFNLNPPRVIFMIVLIAYFLYFFLHKSTFKFDRKVLWLFLGMLVYFAINTQMAGWSTQLAQTRTAPYYRFLGSFLLPFAMMVMVYNAVRDERQARWPFILISIIGWYTIWLGYLQFFYAEGVSWLGEYIFPRILLDPTYGIHIERGRGVFAAAGPQSIFLVTLFFMNMYSIRKVSSAYRYAMVVQNFLIIPAIFFTGIRAGYVSFLVCLFIWAAMSSRRSVGWLKLSAVLVLLLIGVWVFWDNLSSQDRRSGGVAQVKPIVSRQVLLAQSWDTFQEHPITGVGFGHWGEYQSNKKRDVTTLAGMPLGVVLSQHNLFLVILTETGIIGLVALAGVFVGVFLNSLTLYRRLPRTAQGWLSREYVVVFWIIMINYLVSAMFRDLLWDLAGNAMLWSMAGLILGFSRQLEPHTIDLPTASDVWNT